LDDQIKEDEWAGHVAHMGERRRAQTFSLENLKARDNSEDLGVDERIRLKWILRKDERVWNGFIWLRTGNAAGSCKHGNETFWFHKRRGIS
jgi:hypothetical protein